MGEDRPLDENLQEYYDAIQSEFKLASDGTSDEVKKEATKRIVELLPQATSSLNQILINGDKDDSVRLQACKLVFEYSLGKPGSKTEKESDLDKIIAALTSDPVKTS